MGEGAGSQEINGPYKLNRGRLSDGVYVWELSCHVCIFRIGGTWHIGEMGSRKYYTAGQSGSGEFLPPAGRWQVTGPTGGAQPGPHVQVGVLSVTPHHQQTSP